ncbi:MAG: cytidylate kinase-like family protein [Vicinamibacterales bacterium]
MATIVAVSRQFGSGGARIGRAVAQRLAFQYADREILAEAARALEMEEADLEPLEERTASVWERLGELFALGSPDTPFIPPSLPSVNESQLFEVEQRVIKRIADTGKAVIVGRGAAHILGDSKEVLRVFLHAPLQDRVTLAMAEYGFTEREAAEAVVRESDAARAKFVRALTGKDWCDATLYDVTLDTALFGHGRVADLLVGLVEGQGTGALPPVVPRSSEDRDAR